MITAVDEARTEVKCLRMGAYDYLVKPISKDDMLLTLKRALERKQLLDIVSLGKSEVLPELKNSKAFASCITQSEKVYRVLNEAELHAQSDVSILITGESGTGKELLARAIHDASPRANFPFTAINMASRSEVISKRMISSIPTNLTFLREKIPSSHHASPLPFNKKSASASEREIL
jgi:two-component system response regulator AtoC